MTSGGRAPTLKERENNKRRERKRRAIAARIFAGLRQFGNFKLPKHCDNNEVLKALCREAGWTVEEDGTTYKKGCRTIQSEPRGKADLRVPASSSPYLQASMAEGSSKFQWQKGVSAPRAPSPAATATRAANASSSGSDMAASSVQNPSGFPPLQILRGRSCSTAPITPPISSPRLSYVVKPEYWSEASTSKVSGDGGGQISSDCAVTAFSNACSTHSCKAAATASGTSTPTYPPPPVFAASHFHHINCSGPPTPLNVSGASTPTYSSSSLRSLSAYNFNFAAAAALASVQKQHPHERESFADPSSSDSLMRLHPKGSNASRSPGAECISATAADHLHLQSTHSLDIDPSRMATAAFSSVTSRMGLKESIAEQTPSHHHAGTDQQSRRRLEYGLETESVADYRNNLRIDERREGGVDEDRYACDGRLQVRPWEGETIHEVCCMGEQLELTLGNASTKASPTAATSVVVAMSID